VPRLVVDSAHLDQLREHGGLPGIRDENALEAALARPQQKAHDEPDSDLATLAAAYAFGLAKALRRNPAQIAAELAATVVPPTGVARLEAVGPYLNAYVDPASFVRGVVAAPLELPVSGRKVVVEHTSVNPNKEAHVGHLRNIVLGDAVARIERAARLASALRDNLRRRKAPRAPAEVRDRN
jgi:arginyl-tRNA synthetase